MEPTLIGWGKGREKTEFSACKSNERSYFQVIFINLSKPELSRLTNP